MDSTEQILALEERLRQLRSAAEMALRVLYEVESNEYGELDSAINAICDALTDR